MRTLSTMAALAFALVTGSAGAQDLKKLETKGAATPAVDPKDAKTKVSYYFGQQIAGNLKQSGMEIDIETLIKGLREGLAGAKPVYSTAEVEQAMQVWRTEMMAKQQAASKQAGEKAKKEGEAYLAANKAKPGFKATPSGLQYKVITEGTGRTPKLTDTVSANYKGTFIDGTEFDSSEKNGGPQSFPVRGVIRGWTEALQMMKEGGKVQLVIPSDLAYGPEGRPPIPANSVLLFDIELVKIEAGR